MNAKAAEYYILEPFKFKLPGTNPPIRKICLYKGVGGVGAGLAAMLILAFAFLLFAPRDQPYFFLIVLLVTFFGVLLSIIKYKGEFEESYEKPDEVCDQDVVAEIAAIERLTRKRRDTILFVVGINFVTRDGFVLIPSIAFLAIFIIYLMCSYLYRFYLIKKYCPYLVVFDDRRYYGRDESETHDA